MIVFITLIVFRSCLTKALSSVALSFALTLVYRREKKNKYCMDIISQKNYGYYYSPVFNTLTNLPKLQCANCFFSVTTITLFIRTYLAWIIAQMLYSSNAYLDVYIRLLYLCIGAGVTAHRMLVSVFPPRDCFNIRVSLLSR